MYSILYFLVFCHMFLISLYCCLLCNHNLFQIQLSYESYWICEVRVHVFVCMHASKMSWCGISYSNERL